MIRPGPDRLMINARWNSAALTWQITQTVIVREKSDAVLSGQLGNERAMSTVHVVGEQNRIERDSGWHVGVRPSISRRRWTIIKVHSQRGEGREIHGISAEPVRAERRLATIK